MEPFFCAHQVTVRTAFLTGAVVLAVALIICGALSRGSVFFYVAASALLSTATLLLLLHLWITRSVWKESKMERKEIFSLSDYCSQVPLGRESDYPMGPYLVFTLPPPDTPLSRNKERKNLPPLASVETLTPSLLSSSYSIDSVV